MAEDNVEAPPVANQDPYRIADVIVGESWLLNSQEIYEEAEWPDADQAEQIVAKAKSVEARNRARQYLAMNGAATWVRIERAMADASASEDEHPAGSIVAAMTASELTIRYLLLRPLLAGLLFNTRLAMRLVREGYERRTDRDRKLLPDVARVWGIDLEAVRLSNGQLLWSSLLSLVEVRNHWVHRAEPVLGEQAVGAFECAEALIASVVRPLAGRLTLDWPPTGWSHKGRTYDPAEAPYDYMGS